ALGLSGALSRSRCRVDSSVSGTGVEPVTARVMVWYSTNELTTVETAVVTTRTRNAPGQTPSVAQGAAGRAVPLLENLTIKKPGTLWMPGDQDLRRAWHHTDWRTPAPCCAAKVVPN